MIDEERLRSVITKDTDQGFLVRMVIGGEPPAKMLRNKAGEKVHRPGLAGPINGLHWMSDSRLLSLSGAELCFWDATTGQKLFWLELPGFFGRSMHVLPDARSVLVCGPNEIRWCELESGSLLHSFDVPDWGTMSLSPGGEWLFFLMKERVMAWSLEARAMLWQKDCRANLLWADRETIALFFDDKLVLCKSDTGEELGQFVPPGWRERVLNGFVDKGVVVYQRTECNTYFDSYSPRDDDYTVLCQWPLGATEGATALYRQSLYGAGEPVRFYRSHGRWLCNDSERIAVQEQPGGDFFLRCYLWSGLNNRLKSLALAPGRDCLAVGADSGEIFLFDLKPREQLPDFFR